MNANERIAILATLYPHLTRAYLEGLDARCIAEGDTEDEEAAVIPCERGCGRMHYRGRPCLCRG